MSVVDWQERHLNELGEIITGRTPSTKKKEFYGGEYNLISPADLDRGKFVRTAHKKLTKEGFSQCRSLPEKTVLVGCIGNVGKLGMVSGKRSATNQQINALICNSSCDPDYIYYALYASKNQLERAAVKTTIPILNKTNFGNLTLSVPPLDEQKKIAHVLSTVQKAIEAQDKIIETTRELKKAVMHKLFTEGLRGEPQKQTEIGPIPQSWEVASLDELLTMAQYGMSVKGSPDGEHPILRMTNQVNGQIVPHRLQYVDIAAADLQKFKVEIGDILFNRTNSFDLVGRTAIFDISGEFVFASYLIRLRTDPKKLNPHFLNYYFNTDETQARLKSIATRAVSQSNISASRLRGFAVPLPSLKEQANIVSSGVALDAKLSAIRRKREALGDLFRVLLYQLMSAQTQLANTRFL